MKLIGILEKTASKLGPGRAPYFVEVHVIKTLMVIGSEGPVGRVRLARTIVLSEGAMRTLLRHLERQGLIKTSKAGIALTEKGRKISSELQSEIGNTVEVPRSSITVGSFNIALLVKNGARAIKGGIEQRDAAIAIGAQGATTLILKNNELSMPLVNEDIFRDVPQIRERLMSEFKPRENDVIVIGSAHDKLTAEFGAIAAALETLKAK
jgi:predicted transcriptional regulator